MHFPNNEILVGPLYKKISADAIKAKVGVEGRDCPEMVSVFCRKPTDFCQCRVARHLSTANFPLGSCKVTLTCMFKPRSREEKKKKKMHL